MIRCPQCVRRGFRGGTQPAGRGAEKGSLKAVGATNTLSPPRAPSQALDHFPLTLFPFSPLCSPMLSLRSRAGQPTPIHPPGVPHRCHRTPPGPGCRPGHRRPRSALSWSQLLRSAFPGSLRSVGQEEGNKVRFSPPKPFTWRPPPSTKRHTVRKVCDLAVKLPEAALRCTDRQERRAAALRTPFPGKGRFALTPSRDNPCRMPADMLLIEISCCSFLFPPVSIHQDPPAPILAACTQPTRAPSGREGSSADSTACGWGCKHGLCNDVTKPPTASPIAGRIYISAPGQLELEEPRSRERAHVMLST